MCEVLKLIVPLLVGVACFVTAITLFALGGQSYGRQAEKEANYNETRCLVTATGYKDRTCPTRYSYYDCYAPIWVVLHSGNATNATIESETRYRYQSDTLVAQAKYQVRGNRGIQGRYLNV